MGIKGLLLEMAVYGEDEVFAMNPVIAISSKRTEELEDNELIQYVMANIKPIIVPSNYRISNDDIGIVIRHHCGHRKLKKAALLTIPYVINSNLPTAPWRRKTDENGNLINTRDKRLSAMMSAPIQIDGTKYLCNLTLKKGKDGIITPYALTLKDASGNVVEREKMDSHCQVLDNNSEPTTNGNAHLDTVTTSLEANPSMSANITKSNNTNENKTYNNMKKNVQRINESQLRAIVAESVKRVLKEAYVNNVPNNWKPTEFKGTYQDEDGGIYMPDDDLEGYEYMIVTYSGEEIVGKTKVLLPRPGLNAYDDEVPFTLGSNQALIELD